MGDLGAGVELEWAVVFYALLAAGASPAACAKRHPKLKAYAVETNRQAKEAVSLVYKVNPRLLKQAAHSDEVNITGNPEPKTDVVFGDIRCSVKMTGPIQLASGQGASTSEVFRRVMASMKVAQPKKLLSLILDIERLPTKLLSEGNIPRLKAEKPEVLKEFMNTSGEVRKDASYEYWLENNKGALLGHILDYLQKDPAFQKALIREAMTGELLFGASNKASATHILTAEEFAKIDDTLVSKVLKKTTIDIRAKSRGGITAIAFRFDCRM